MISAGRVLLMLKGDYDPTVTYEMLDIVSYNGSSYIAKSTTTGNLPTNTTYWQLSAYGGQAANLAGNFAPLETTDYASRAYAIDDIFVDKSSQLVIATTTINIGDEIEIGSNCDATTMAELLDAIENRYDALDQRNRKLVGINPITIQTDLHLLAPGEYFKKLTNFYVTNAPTGINQVPTAIFRLTVESGLDESGSSLLLTLRTIEGEIYTQAYDGSVWSDWRKAGDVDSSDLGTAAAKDSTNEVTSGSTDLVESGAVYTEIQTLTNQVTDISDEIADMNNVLGAKNLLPKDHYEAVSNSVGVTTTINTDGSISLSGQFTAQASVLLCDSWTVKEVGWIKELEGKNVKFSGNVENLNVVLRLTTSGGNNDKGTGYNVDGENEFTMPTGVLSYALYIYPNSSMLDVSGLTIRPMLRLASIQDDTYEPYSMTNREITPYVQAISNPNLLDNPWFTVNQRGQSSYNEVGYTVDRWRQSATLMTINITSNGLEIRSNNSSSHFHQILENNLSQQLADKVITFSIKVINTTSTNWRARLRYLDSGGTFIGQLIIDGLEVGLNNVTGLVPSNTVTITCEIFDTNTSEDSTIIVDAIKLELGSVSTLVMDTAPNYATELLKCQRYFQVLPKFGRWRVCAISTDLISVEIDLPVTMRAVPSIVNNGATLHIRSLDQRTDILCSGMSIGNYSRDNYSTILLQGEKAAHGMTDGQLNIQNADLWLSADL